MSNSELPKISSESIESAPHSTTTIESQDLSKNIKKTSVFTIKTLLIGLLTIIVGGYLCTFKVYPGQTALVFSMGELIESTEKTGLHFKLPSPLAWAKIIDRRIKIVNSPENIAIKTLDKKNIMVDSFTQWRIFDPKKFYLRFKNNTVNAEQLITTLVRDSLNTILSQRTFTSILIADRNEISVLIRQAMYEKLIDIGIDAVSVQIKYIGHMPEVVDSVFDRMKNNQINAVKQQSIEADLFSQTIHIEANNDSDEIIAQANQHAQTIKGEADASVSELYANAITDKEFYNFYRSLEAYRTGFANKQSLLVVDSSSDFFKYFHSPIKK